MDLHCLLCVEEYDLKERQPVVLPCGHTYICKICAGKLKVCHECREPLFWTPPRPQQPPSVVSNIHRSPATARYARYNQHHSRYGPSTPPQKPAVVPREEIPLPCPKNVVLMEMIEAKKRQERIMAEEKERQQQQRAEKREAIERKKLEREKLRLLRQADMCPGSTQPGMSYEDSFVHGSISLVSEVEEEDLEEDDYDDEISSSSASILPLGEPELNSGYAALSGTCGTYIVRDPEGLVVLPNDPHRQKYQRMQQEHLSDEKKEQDEFQNVSQQFSSLFLDDDYNDETSDSGNHPSSTRRKEPFSIEEGQKVQVVGVLESANEEGVYQLARGVGYIVATSKQLVKIGGPLEASCQFEGMLQSVIEKQQEMQRKLNEITQLSIGLKKKIILEQDKPEQVPIISSLVPKNETVLPSNSDGSNNTASNGNTVHPTTPTQRRSSRLHPNSPTGGSCDRSMTSADSTNVELGAGPRTPGPGATTPGASMEYHPIATAQMRQQDFANSPARSCPMPNSNIAHIQLDQPYLDDDTPSGAGILRYRVNSDDDASGLGWAGVLGCGSSLFGERLMDSSQNRESTSASNIFNAASTGNGDLMRLALDESNVQRRAAALAQAAAGSSAFHHRLAAHGSTDSPLRRGGSFDGGTSGGVNFRGGYSNHGGLGRTRRVFGDQQIDIHGTGNSNSGHNRTEEPRRQLMMSQMSQHRGVGVSSIQRRTTHPDTLIQTSSR